MWVSVYDQEWKPYDLIQAQEILGKRVKYQKDAVWDVTDYQNTTHTTNWDNGLPDWVWKLSSTQCKKLICDIVIGYEKFPAELHNIYYLTGSIQLSNDMMRLCLHAGWVGNVIMVNSIWKVNIIRTGFTSYC